MGEVVALLQRVSLGQGNEVSQAMLSVGLHLPMNEAFAMPAGKIEWFWLEADLVLFGEVPEPWRMWD